MLTSEEKRALAHFITSSKDQREDILKDARLDPKVSGCLVHAYETVKRF